MKKSTSFVITIVNEDQMNDKWTDDIGVSRISMRFDVDGIDREILIVIWTEVTEHFCHLSPVVSLMFIVWPGRVFPLWTVIFHALWCPTASAIVTIFVILVLLYQRRFAVCCFVDDKIVSMLFERFQFGFDGTNCELFAHFRWMWWTCGQHGNLNFRFWFLHFVLQIKGVNIYNWRWHCDGNKSSDAYVFDILGHSNDNIFCSN